MLCLCRLTALYWSDLGRECVFDAAVFLACGFGVGRWQQGWWRTACCVSILFVCIHLGDAAAFVPKNSLCPPARPFLCSDLYLRFLRFVPLIPGLLLCLSVLSFVPPHLHVTPVISFPVHPSWPLQCKRSSGSVISKDIQARVMVRSFHQRTSEGWKSRFGNFFFFSPLWVSFHLSFLLIALSFSWRSS